MKTMFQPGNTKMKATAKANDVDVLTLDLPAIKTCPFAKHCKQKIDPAKPGSVQNGGYCYACKGRYGGTIQKACYERNLEMTKREDFVQTAVEQLLSLVNKKTKKTGFKLDGNLYRLVVRLNASGDVYSREYLLKLFEIAKAVPSVLFYCYTKSHPLFNGLEVPSNFKYIPSKGGTHDHLLDGKPCAIVVTKDTTRKDLPVGTVLGVQDDLKNLKNYLAGKVVALKLH